MQTIKSLDIDFKFKVISDYQNIASWRLSTQLHYDWMIISEVEGKKKFKCVVRPKKKFFFQMSGVTKVKTCKMERGSNSLSRAITQQEVSKMFHKPKWILESNVQRTKIKCYANGKSTWDIPSLVYGNKKRCKSQHPDNWRLTKV